MTLASELRIGGVVQMSAPDIDRRIMDSFSDLAGDAHLTMLLGAGASAPSGLPDWDTFSVSLAVRSGLVDSPDAARILLDKQDPTIVLEAAHSRLGSKWAGALNEALYGHLDHDPTPSPLHLAAIGHCMAEPQRSTLATLNFDTLLEQAAAANGSKTVAVDTLGCDDPVALTVHHLHGAVLPDDEYSAVVGYNDFAELVADQGAWQREFLSKALRRGPLLLAGTSYRDPDIRHWLHLIMRDERPTYPALVTIIREAMELDRGTFSLISNALASEWESIGLHALVLDDLSDIALVVRELQTLGSLSYRPPAERVRRVWEAHRLRFADLQPKYVEHLDEDSVLLESRLNVSARRGTLWLAKSGGKLARWASHGTIFAGVKNLKLVPTGHDSAWIAGEAIASEEVKIKDVDRIPGVSPTWRSVLAIPVFASDGQHPDFATGAVTFGLSAAAATVISKHAEALQQLSTQISEAWRDRISTVAFRS